MVNVIGLNNLHSYTGDLWGGQFRVDPQQDPLYMELLR